MDEDGPERRPDDNFTPLTSLDWQVHVYGDAAPEVKTVCDARKLPLHVFPWRPEISRTGLQRNAVYLVRPDGYVGMVNPEGQQRRSRRISTRANSLQSATCRLLSPCDTLTE